MKRRRRQPAREQKLLVSEFDCAQEISKFLEFRLNYLQLQADLELMKIDRLLNQQIRILQQRRLEQLGER